MTRLLLLPSSIHSLLRLAFISVIPLHHILHIPFSRVVIGRRRTPGARFGLWAVSAFSGPGMRPRPPVTPFLLTAVEPRALVPASQPSQAFPAEA